MWWVDRGSTRRVLAVLGVVLVDLAADPRAPPGGPGNMPHPPPPPSSLTILLPSHAQRPQPEQVWPRRSASHPEQAGIDAQLLMAILYNESYKPHDPRVGARLGQQLKPDAAFGVANMHRAAFDETKQRHDFATRTWEELPDDRTLAVEAAAWYLHDLAAQLPAHRSGPVHRGRADRPRLQHGPGNMLAFARGTAPGAAAHSYLEPTAARQLVQVSRRTQELARPPPAPHPAPSPTPYLPGLASASAPGRTPAAQALPPRTTESPAHERAPRRARAASRLGPQHVDLTARRERVEAVLDQPANRQQASQ